MALPVLQKSIGNAASTTVSGSVSDSATSADLTSDTNFNAASGEGMVLIDEAAATEEIAYSASKSSSTISIPLANRGLEGGSAQAHSAGASIKGVLTSGMWNNVITVLTEIFSQTTGKFQQLKDANGNEILKHVATASAVNEFTLTNAATGNAPVISATGGDDNINLDLKAKGTGTVRKPTSVSIQVFDGTTNTTTGDGKFYFTIPEELNGMNLVGVHGRVITAGTTGTTDIQIANVTDSVDMLSTKLTIDSGETGSDTAATAAVIDTTKDDVVTNDLIRIDCDATSTTKAKGYVLRMRFALP